MNQNEEKMHISAMTREDFEKVPQYDGAIDGFDPDTDSFRSLVIIPTGEEHESGWGCMEFALIDKEGHPICRVCGYSDVVHIDGIGGYGFKWLVNGPRLANGQHVIHPHGWCIDCLPCGYLRLFSQGELILDRPFMQLSSFEVYCEEEEKK